MIICSLYSSSPPPFNLQPPASAPPPRCENAEKTLPFDDETRVTFIGSQLTGTRQSRYTSDRAPHAKQRTSVKATKSPVMKRIHERLAEINNNLTLNPSLSLLTSQLTSVTIH